MEEPEMKWIGVTCGTSIGEEAVLRVPADVDITDRDAVSEYVFSGADEQQYHLIKTWPVLCDIEDVYDAEPPEVTLGYMRPEPLRGSDCVVSVDGDVMESDSIALYIARPTLPEQIYDLDRDQAIALGHRLLLMVAPSLEVASHE